MKIAINARLLKAVPGDGISRFTYEVVKRLVASPGNHRIALVFDTEPDKRLSFSDSTDIHVIKPPSRHPVLWYTWHEWQLPPLLQITGADIFLSPDGIISLRSSVPSVPVIHDINFYHRPKDIPPLTSLYYRTFFNLFAHKAARIITVSGFCKQDISEHLNVSPGKIDVAYNGISDYFTPAAPAETENFREQLTGGSPYFLFVGNFSPRKNIAGLISAFNLFRKNSGLNHKLVLTGGRLYLNREADKVIKVSPFREDIILTGQMKHEELRIVYSSATALVFIPWFEGFGIPAAEAMRCGTPVILSSTSSLPEIGGDAALYVNPADPRDVSEAMVKVADSTALRNEMSVKGLSWSEKFTWDKTSEAVMNSLEKALNEI